MAVLKRPASILLLFAASMLVCFSSCSDDDPDDIEFEGEWKEVNKWIYERMTDYYLWYDEIPSQKKLDGMADPDELFYNLLSRKDGKDYLDEDGQTRHYYYSYLTAKGSSSKSYMGEDISLGFEYQTYYNDQKQYSLRVLYVLPDSPAEIAGIKRGDWVVRIDGNDVSTALISSLDNGSTHTLGLSDEFRGTVNRTVSVTARAVTDNPVYEDKIITYNGQEVAYLMYNHFNPSETGTGDGAFNASLREAFAGFKNKGVRKLILDLRYNGGGYVDCANLLAGMIVPEASLGDLFCKTTYNMKNKSDSSEKYFNKGAYTTDIAKYNLNLDEVYIITSSRSASASELVIAGLQPYMDVIIIGDRTEGKNVGSINFSDSKYDWELQPIVCTVTNKNNYEYSSGIPADFEVIVDNKIPLGVIGHPEEYLLMHALEVATTGSLPGNEQFTKGSREDLIPGYYSLDRKWKKSGGLILQ